MTEYLTVSGAYGRDYATQKAAIADWRDGKDFVIRTIGPHYGRYISIREVPEGTRIIIRYKFDQRTCQAPSGKGTR